MIVIAPGGACTKLPMNAPPPCVGLVFTFTPAIIRAADIMAVPGESSGLMVMSDYITPVTLLALGIIVQPASASAAAI